MRAELQVLTGPEAGRRILISGDEITLGAEPQCDVLLHGEGLWPVHARIYRQDGRWYLIDYAAQEPTMRDGAPVGSMPARISDQDVIELGEVSLLFSDPDPSVERVKFFPNKRRPDMIRAWHRSGGMAFWMINVLAFFCFICCLGIPEVVIWFTLFFGLVSYLFYGASKQIGDRPLGVAAIAAMVMSGVMAIICAVLLVAQRFA